MSRKINLYPTPESHRYWKNRSRLRHAIFCAKIFNEKQYLIGPEQNLEICPDGTINEVSLEEIEDDN